MYQRFCDRWIHARGLEARKNSWLRWFWLGKGIFWFMLAIFKFRLSIWPVQGTPSLTEISLGWMIVVNSVLSLALALIWFERGAFYRIIEDQQQRIGELEEHGVRYQAEVRTSPAEE